MRGDRSSEQRHLEAGRVLGRLRREISEASLGQTLVLVEGKRDRNRLNELGFNVDAICVLNQGHSINGRLDALLLSNPELEHLEVFMDWDRTGGRLQRRCMRYLISSDAPASEVVRDAMVRLLTPETRMVEHIGRWDGLIEGMETVDPPPVDHLLEE
ncbi:MAG: hypothetical protein CL992_03995 [Euryarchaeota archaeon]|nr:hypothetical protein [Euryarchaeota archaeon]